jgi:RNA polymerase sigma factor (sigma-70 family)
MPALALATLTQEAATGCEDAWRNLVARFDPMLRAIARGYRLDEADVSDVVQVTWMRAFRNLGRLDEPAAVAGWLAVTARREALRTLQRGVREFPSEDPAGSVVADDDTPDAAVERERRDALRAAVRRLPDRQRDLLTAMLDHRCGSYEELSSTLVMPIGSIGPTRERAFERLRSDGALARALAS